MLRHLCIMEREDDHLHLSCESSDSEEDKTLPENASKQYGLQPYQFEPHRAENRSADDSSVQEDAGGLRTWQLLGLYRVVSSLLLLFLLREKYLGTF